MLPSKEAHQWDRAGPPGAPSLVTCGPERHLGLGPRAQMGGWWGVCVRTRKCGLTSAHVCLADIRDLSKYVSWDVYSL